MKAAIRAWRGQERLWKVFWLYNVLLGTAITAALEATFGMHWAILAVAAIVAITWCVWVMVAMWRCAFNVDWRGWGYIVQGLVVLGIVIFIGSFFVPIE